MTLTAAVQIAVKTGKRIRRPGNKLNTQNQGWVRISVDPNYFLPPITLEDFLGTDWEVEK